MGYRGKERKGKEIHIGLFIPTNLTANNLPCQRYDPATTAGFLNFAILSIYFKRYQIKKREKKSFPKKSDKRIEQDFSMFLCSAIKWFCAANLKLWMSENTSFALSLLLLLELLQQWFSTLFGWQHTFYQKKNLLHTKN